MIKTRALVLRATTIALVGVGMTLLFTDSAAATLLLLAAIGGGLTAAVLVRRRTHEGHASLSLDAFEGGGASADVINISRVRVAGFGGAGLLFISALVALEYQLTAVALAAGAVGGAIGGIAVILYRRRHLRTVARL